MEHRWGANLLVGLIGLVLALPMPAHAASQTDEFQSNLRIHRTLGLITLPLVGLQVGLGLGLSAENFDDRSAALRHAHLMNSLILGGLALFQWDYGARLAGKKKEKSAHGKWAHAYLGILALTGIAGFAQFYLARAGAGSTNTMKHIHTGLGALAGGATIGIALTIPYGI